MKKWICGIAALLISTGSFAGRAEVSLGEFSLRDLHRVASEGIRTYLGLTGLEEDSVTKYSVEKIKDGAILTIFFTDNTSEELFCHFHGFDNGVDCH